jgi:HEAT repeats
LISVRKSWNIYFLLQKYISTRVASFILNQFFNPSVPKSGRSSLNYSTFEQQFDVKHFKEFIMKKYLLGLVVISFMLTGVSFAASLTKRDSAIMKGEKNLLIAINTDNYGLKSSAAQILGDIKSEKAVIPLMKILKSSDDENLRIVAALSLYKIQSSMGMFAVRQAIRFDESARVRKMCLNLYLDSEKQEFAAARQR